MRHSIGGFDKSKLRRSQTEEKNPLPSPEGNRVNNASVLYHRTSCLTAATSNFLSCTS